MEWLKKQWRWVAVGAALVAAFVWGFFTRKPKIVSPSQEDDAARRAVEAEATRRQASLRRELELQLQAIQQDKSSAITELTTEQVAQYETRRDNPPELTKWLLKVGKDLR
jgi:ABC-type transport system involved in cytochrome bd biosynthesis fused ATPase/permease subunit